MVIEDSLAGRSRDLRLILAHELFHFAWWRLGNRSRGEFDGLLRNEVAAGARGELGESAAVAKSAAARCGIVSSSSSWKQYTCESFCDTAAWLYAGVSAHKCFQLAARWREKRGSWFQQLPPFRV